MIGQFKGKGQITADVSAQFLPIQPNGAALVYCAEMLQNTAVLLEFLRQADRASVP